jgi:hypothetical protein
MLASSSTPLSLIQQRRIFTWAKAHKDFDLIARLGGYAALADELDVELAKINNHAVQAAWVSRPGRNIATLSERARKDKRVAVLQLLAGIEGLETSAYTAMAKSTSRSVAHPLLGNRSVDLELRRQAMRVMTFGIKNASYADQDSFKRALGEFPELVPAAIEVAGRDAPDLSNPTEASVVFEAFFGRSVTAVIDDLDTPTSEALFDLLATHLGTRLKTYDPSNDSRGWYHRDGANRIAELMRYATQGSISPAMTSASREKLLLLTAAYESKIKNSNQLKDPYDLFKTSLAATPQAAASLSPGRLAFETDPAVLLKAANGFDLKSPAASAIAAAIIANRASTLEAVKVVLDRTSTGYYHSLNSSVIAARANDVEVVAEILSRYPYSISDEVLEKSSNPQQLMIELCSRNPREIGPIIAASRFMTKDMVGILPVDFLEAFGGRHNVSAATCAMVVDFVTEALGDNPAAWEMFEDLVTTAPGNINQLLRSINNLIGMES